MKWDLRFLALAKFVSGWSKDPSTKVGAVITDSNNRIISLGYNGFPRGVDDSPERYQQRDVKYDLVIHAEINAILFANRSLKGASLYIWPMFPCIRCATVIIQNEIQRVIAPSVQGELRDRWGGSIKKSTELFHEARIDVTFI